MNGFLTSHPSKRRVIVAWFLVGLLAATAMWVAFVVLASAELRGITGDATVSKGFAGVDVVTTSRIQTEGSSSVALKTNAGAAALLVLPALGALVGARATRKSS